MIQLPSIGIKGMVSANKTASKEVETTAFNDLLQLLSESEQETEEKNETLGLLSQLFQPPLTQTKFFQVPNSLIEETSSPVAGKIDPNLVQEVGEPLLSVPSQKVEGPLLSVPFQKVEEVLFQPITVRPNRVEVPIIEQSKTHVMNEHMNVTPLQTVMEQNTGGESENKQNDNHSLTSKKEVPAPTELLGNIIVESNTQTQNNTGQTTENSIHKQIPVTTVRLTHLEKDVAQILQTSIHANGTQDGMEATFSLHPNHLGKVDVKVSIKDGNVTAEFLASSTLGKDVLETNVHALRTALEQQGFQVDKIDVSQQTASFANAFSQKGDSQSRQGQQDSRKRNERFLHNQEEDYADFSTELGLSSQINTTA